MKKLLLIMVVAALALSLVPLAFAGAPGGGGWKHGHAKFNAVGKVTAVAVADTVADPAAVSTLTFKVRAGSHIKGLKGTEATFNVAADAKIWQITKHARVAKTLADVSAGDWVKLKGTVAKVSDGNGGTTRVFTITNLRYKDLTPETTPPAQP